MTQIDSPQNSVVIYGSCVARDTFTFLDTTQYRLNRYIARQSLISACSEPTHLPEGELASLGSAFQQRTLRDDFSSSLLSDLRTFGNSADVLLWDITDERFGVWKLGEKQYVTRSVELVASGLDHKLAQRATLIPFGSHEHLRLWSTALLDFQQAIVKANISSQPIMLAPQWAKKDENGRGIKPATSSSTAKMNRFLKRYEKAAMRVARVVVPDSPTRGNSRHQWGLAPYHYGDDVYLELAEKIKRALATPVTST